MIEVSCCIIAKNEEAHIKGCLQSVFQEVDEIIFVDTGSTDKTVEIASQFTPKLKLFYYEWHDDFASARNFSLSKAKGSWIFYLDADERLNTLGKKNILRELAKLNLADGYSVGIRSFSGQDSLGAGSFDWAVRFFKKLEGIKFQRTIHESVEPFLLRRNAKILPAPFIIDHFGYNLSKEAFRKKVERNLKILLKEVETNPEDIYSWYHLSVSYYNLEDKEKAREAIEKAYKLLENKEETPGNQLKCFVYNFRARFLLEKKLYEEALVLLEKSLQTVPRQNSARLLMASIFFEKGEYEKAIPFLEFSINFFKNVMDPFNNPSELSMEFSVPLVNVKKTLSYCYLKTQNYEKGYKLIEEDLKKETPDSSLLFIGGLCQYYMKNLDLAINLLSLAYNDQSQPIKEALPFLISLECERGNLEKAFALFPELAHLEEREVPYENTLKTFRFLFSSLEGNFYTYSGYVAKFLEILARSTAWQERIPPLLDIILAKEKASTIQDMAEHYFKDEISKHRFLTILHIKTKNLKQALLHTYHLLNLKDEEAIKLHGGLLLQLGRAREAERFLRANRGDKKDGKG